MPKLRPKMFDESAKSHAPKELWKLVMCFAAVFIVIILAESAIPAIMTAKPMIDSINEITESTGTQSVTFQESMDAATEVAMKPVYLVITLLCTAFGTIISLIYCRGFEMRHISSMGVRGGKRRALIHYAEGMLIGILMMTLITLLTVAFGVNSIKMLSGLNYKYLLLYLIGFLIQGMSEEFIFRGYFMTTLGARHNSYLAIIISSAAFGLAHIANPGLSPLAMFNLILFGVFAAVYMIHFDDIWGVCGIHSLWNYSQGCIYGISVSGGSETESFLRTNAKSSHDFLTGGRFGIEGSLFTTVVLFAGTAMVLYLEYRRERLSAAASSENVQSVAEPEDVPAEKTE